MSLSTFFRATAEEAEALEESYGQLMKRCGGELTTRLQQQRRIIHSVLQKVNEKNSWSDYCWPQELVWASGASAHLTIVKLTATKLRVEVRQKGVVTGTYWVPTHLLFSSDRQVASYARRVHWHELQKDRAKRLKELQQAEGQLEDKLRRAQRAREEGRQELRRLKRRLASSAPHSG